MLVKFEVEVTSDGAIILPDEYKELSGRTVTVMITDPIEIAKANTMKFAGIWKGLTDEDLGLDDFEERRGRLVEKEAN